MLLPETYFAALLLMVLSAFCWGSWANTFKMTGNWRFELYYYDFAFGVLFAAVIAAFTFGTWPSGEGLEFLDDLTHGGKRQMVLTVLSGGIFNLGNMLFLGAISIAGLSVAYPIGGVTALLVATVFSFIMRPQGNAPLLFSGLAILVASMVAGSLAYRSRELRKLEERIKSGKAKSTLKRVSLKGVYVSVAAGVFMGAHAPLIGAAGSGDSAMGIYSIGFLFALGVCASAFVLNLFLMNLPLAGPPVEILEYFRAGWKRHILGWLGGVILFTGWIAALLSQTPPERATQLGPAISFSLRHSAVVLAAFWGFLLWKEYAGTDIRAKSLVLLMLVLFLTGLVLVAVVPL
ncbi:MAG: hypothetical protein WD696_12835 [Bryobacteraceae bacterium]